MADARLHPRQTINAIADVIGREVVLGRHVADISLGGCRIEGSPSEQVESDVDMVLCFPELSANLPLGGLVVRSEDDHMAIRFQGLNDEQKWALRKHIRETK